MANAQKFAYRFGDKVLTRHAYEQGLIPARVIRDLGHYVKVALSLRSVTVENNLRHVPIGTPVYLDLSYRDVQMVERDNQWNPYSVFPFSNPPDHALLGGAPGFATPDIPGLTHVGAYIAGNSYEPGDPAWAWDSEEGWQEGVVINGKRSWVAVRCLRGRRARSYRPAKVWPAICDFPKPVLQIEVKPEWARVADLPWARVVSRQLGNSNRLGRNPGL